MCRAVPCVVAIANAMCGWDRTVGAEGKCRHLAMGYQSPARPRYDVRV